MWSGRCCVLELKFQDQEVNPPQATPISMYVQPFWLIHSVFLALQLYSDSWVGMMETSYFDKNGKKVGSFGGNTGVADSRSITKESIIKRLDKKYLLKLMGAQFRQLELSIDRYSRASAEIVDESIIDFVIVLESLLGAGLGNEISHRISARGAFLLSPKAKTREQYYIVFKYFYDLRSKMVHGLINEIKSPSPESKKKSALVNLGAELSDKWWEDRYEISDIARRLSRKVLIYFIENEDKWNTSFLESLELGIKASKNENRI